MRIGHFFLFPRRFILILCLWLAFWLRVWGLDFGLPHEFHPDEHQYVDIALTWHLNGQLDLGYINPPLFTYVLIGAYWLWFAVSPFVSSNEWISSAYVFARLWSVAFGLLTVALAYPLGKRLHNQKVGLVAMLLLAGLFLPARESHFAVNDTSVTFWVMLTTYLSLVLFQDRRWSNYVLAGLFVGLAAATKLTGGVAVLVLLVAHGLGLVKESVLSWGRFLKTTENRRLGVSMLIAGATFLLVAGHIFGNLPRFFETINKHLQFGMEGYKGLQMTPATGWGFYTNVLGWGMGWLMSVFALIIVGIVFWRRYHPALIVAIFPVALFTYLGGQKILFARFILPALPPLVLLTALGVVWLADHWLFVRRHQTLFILLISLALLAQPLSNLLWFDHLLTLPDTRQIATQWFVEKFPEQTVVVKESYSILPNTFLVNKNWPYKVIQLDERGPTRNDIDYYVSHKTEVIALSNFTFDRRRADLEEEQSRQRLLAFLDEKAELIKIFDPYRPTYRGDWFYLDQLYGPAAETLERDSPGPLIKVYRLPYESQPYTLDIPSIPVLIYANFDDKLTLLGYDLPTRRAEPGGALPLTLYWQASSRLEKTYVVFTRLLDSEQRRWGGYDRWPQETANTMLWHPGEIVTDIFSLPVNTDAPAGVYTIDVGLYDQADPSASSLPLLRDNALIGQSSVRIGPVKVGGPPPGAVLLPAKVSPQHSLSIELGQPPLIMLHGYDLFQTETELRLRFYWESLAPSPIDWSIFAHLRNQQHEIIAQKDGPASLTYPTSLWDAGEIIADEIVIPLPVELPSGEYDLVVGMYDFATDTRLPVKDSPDGTILLQSFEVLAE